MALSQCGTRVSSQGGINLVNPVMLSMTHFRMQAVAICLFSACQEPEGKPPQSISGPSDSTSAVSASDATTNTVDFNYRESFVLINNSADQYGRDEPNPAATVRAVNHLQSVGKTRAIDILREYQEYAKDFGDGGEQDMPSQHRLCLIIPLLFVPSEEGAELPSLGRSPTQDGTSKEWKPLLITLKGDLPFHREAHDVRGSQLPNRDYLIEWAERHGRLRDKRLRPSDDSLKVADEICKALPNKTGGARRYQNSYIRRQAWRTIQHLIPHERDNDRIYWESDDGWSNLKKKAHKLAIRWSEEKQDYVAE